MVYCAAFGCNNQAKRGNGISFFKFPKDSNRRKVWAHYCNRWNFVPASGNRLCSVHFSKDDFSQNPMRMAELGVDGKFYARLNPDAVPSIPLTVTREVKDDRPTQLQMPTRALSQKRMKAEVEEHEESTERDDGNRLTGCDLQVKETITLSKYEMNSNKVQSIKGKHKRKSKKVKSSEQPESEMLPSCSTRPTVETSGANVNNICIESQNLGTVAHENNSGLIYNIKQEPLDDYSLPNVYSIKQEPVDDYSLTNVYNESQDCTQNSVVNNDSQTNSFSPIIYDNVNSSDNRRKMTEVASSSILSKTHVNQEKQSSTPPMVFRNAKHIQNTNTSDSMGGNSSHNMGDNSSHHMGDNSSHNMGDNSSHNTGANSTTYLFKVSRLQPKDSGTDKLNGNQILEQKFNNSKWRNNCLNILKDALQNTINRLEDLGVDVAAWVIIPNNDQSSQIHHMGSQKGREFIKCKQDIDAELNMFLENHKRKDNGQKNNSKDISEKKLKEDSCSVKNITTSTCDGEPPKSISDNKAVPCSSLDDCKPTNVLFSVKGLDDNSSCIVVRQAEHSSKEELQVNTASTSSSNEKEKIQLKRKISSVDTDPLSDEMNSNKRNKGIHKCDRKMEKVTSSDSTPRMVPVNIVILQQPVSEVLPSCPNRPTVETSDSNVNNICIESQNLGTVGHENNSGLIYNIKQEPVDDYSLTNVYNESQDGTQNSVANSDSQTNSFSTIIYDNVNSSDNRRKLKEVASSSILSKTHVNQEKQSCTPVMVFRNAKHIQNTTISNSMGGNSSHNIILNKN